MKYKSTPISKMKYMNMKNNRDKALISVMGRMRAKGSIQSYTWPGNDGKGPGMH